jgi:hypothetical protein
VVERFPPVLGLAAENMEEHFNFLRGVGVAEDQLGQVGASPFL